MKKSIGILYEAKFVESSFETGCGGSETWVIQISKKFVENGYHVIVFNHENNWTITKNGVEYRPISTLFKYTCETHHFDYFIFTRNVGQEYYDIIVNNNCADKIYVQSHDMHIWADGLYNKKLDWNVDAERFSKINKFIALTDFHKEELHNLNNIPYAMISVIGNGLDSEIYDNVYNNYEHSPKDTDPFMVPDSNCTIFWTSAFGRGGDILVEDIFPLVKEQCPNAKINICGYSDGVPEHIKNTEGVNFLGTLSKEDYYKVFFDSDVWFLPCVVVEDFGICAAEALMCHCDVVSPFLHGMKDVLYPYTNTAMERNFGDATTDTYHYGTYHIDKDTDEYKKACMEAASWILWSFGKYRSLEHFRWKESARRFIINTYTWQSVVDKWKNLFNE